MSVMLRVGGGGAVVAAAAAQAPIPEAALLPLPPAGVAASASSGVQKRRRHGTPPRSAGRAPPPRPVEHLSPRAACSSTAHGPPAQLANSGCSSNSYAAAVQGCRVRHQQP